MVVVGGVCTAPSPFISPATAAITQFTAMRPLHGRGNTCQGSCHDCPPSLPPLAPGCLDYIFVATHALCDGGSGSSGEVAWTPLPSAPVPVEALGEPSIDEIAALVTAAPPHDLPEAGGALVATSATSGGGDGGTPLPEGVPAEVPRPTRELSASCPNVAVPSDHIPVVVTLVVKRE